MKKSIIILGIAVVTFSNVLSALAQQSSVKEDGLAQTVSLHTALEGSMRDNHTTESRKSNASENSANSNPETIVIPTYQKTMEEIIAENNQIIESDMSPEQYVKEGLAEDDQIELPVEASPVSSEKAIEERIQQDIQVTEGTVLNAIMPSTSKKSKKS